ncbi:MAG: DNA-directed RNA polymerase subunit H [Nanoarchaeota archaeon]|nr:DNA-directed RNA polymerase subunit H [Nanoarchaeota archaeon]
MAKKKTKKAALKIDAHILVPKHVKLNKDETKALFEHYKITNKELPRILKNDPAIVNLNVEIGDVVKITRNGSVAGTSVFYRTVSN